LDKKGLSEKMERRRDFKVPALFSELKQEMTDEIQSGGHCSGLKRRTVTFYKLPGIHIIIKRFAPR